MTDVVPPGDEHPGDDLFVAPASPPRRRSAAEPAPFVRREADRWGVASCVLGFAGVVQLAFWHFPLLAAFAISVGLTGRRFGELDSDGMHARNTSLVGLVLGVFGVALGLLLWFHYRTWNSLVDV